MQHLAIVIICRLSVTRVYCNETAEARIMQFSPKCSLNSLPVKIDYEIQRGSPLSGGSNWGGPVSDFTMLYLRNGAR